MTAQKNKVVIKIKLGIWTLLYTLFFNSVFGIAQGTIFHYDLNRDTVEDSVYLTTDGASLNVLLSQKKGLVKKTTINLPEIIGYEKINIRVYKPQYVDIEYSSSHVATIDLILSFKNNDCYIAGVVLFAPCQSCEDTEIKTCERVLNKNLSDFKENDINELLDQRKDCRVNHENIEYDLQKTFLDIYSYYTKIKYLEKSTSPERLEKYIRQYPITRSRTLYYQKIALFLKKAGQYSQSIFLLKEIIRMNPRNSQPYFYISEIFQEIGEIEAAERYRKQYLKLKAAK